MRDYLHCLIRYVPDGERMEPMNVGLVLQGQGRTQVKFSPHAARRGNVDTKCFQQWRAFFNAEVDDQTDADGDELLFRPNVRRPEFLEHLARLTDLPFTMSRPLRAAIDDRHDFDDVFDRLFRRLVLRSDEPAAEEVPRPTGRYRELEKLYDLLKRGVKRHAPVTLDQSTAWYPHRQVINGSYLAMDKIEVGRELTRTATELNAVSGITGIVERFLHEQVDGRQTAYFLFADTLSIPFKDQGDRDFKRMRDDIARTADKVEKIGGSVIRTVIASEQFASSLDASLPQTG